MYGGSLAEFEPMTIEMARAWVRRLQEQPYAWVIDLDGRLIGEIRLHGIDEADRRAALAVGIADPGALGRGVGTESIRLVLGFAFTTLQLHRVSVRVLAYNTRAIAAYEKCGFIIEGRERETALVDGKWYDDIMMAILASDFALSKP
jgi:RimJ/RimL family protein N-acetyltransferase